MLLAGITSGVVILVGILVYFLQDARSALARVREAERLREKERQMARENEWHQSTVELTAQILGLRETMAALATSLQFQKDQTPALVEGLSKIPILVEGLTEMCQHSARQADALNKAVDTLQASILRAPDADSFDEYATETPDAIRAQQRQEIRDLMRKGVPEGEAESRVRERSIYEQLTKR